MSDFQFLQNPLSKKWVILAPRRAKRPDVAKGIEPVCPFCPGREGDEPELYRVEPEFMVHGSKMGESPATVNSERITTNWLVRVIPNKFPFAPIHEIIIHSPDHHKNFGELPLSQVELILQTYRQRYLTHKEKGQIFIFHNRGEKAGESLPHGHTQLAVVPMDVKTDIPRLDPSSLSSGGKAQLGVGPEKEEQNQVVTKCFYIFCPKTSQWPDEVWIAPKQRGRAFGEITDEEIPDLASALTRLIQIFDLRHGHEFPYNFYLYPGGDWYLRIIPRLKTIGGFELASGIFVNTQDPRETIEFIKEHFEEPNHEKIKTEHQAEYERRV